MNVCCPVCDEILIPMQHRWDDDHYHVVGKYRAYYDVFVDGRLTTEVWLPTHTSDAEIVLSGLVILDEERIERLLILK